MKVLVTSSRMPFALGMVRELAAAGHEVYAADDYERSPGSHSKYLAGHFVYPSPRDRTEDFIAELERIIGEAGIDVIVPAFEEAFYISTQRERLSQAATIFVAAVRGPRASARQGRVRGAWSAASACRSRRPWSRPSDAELAAATERFERYFARAAFSRGGVDLLTNTGPLAGALDLADVHPTPAAPWLVQPFVDGETVCTYSTVHAGVVSSHLMYRIPRQWHHCTGIQFESIDAPSRCS